MNWKCQPRAAFFLKYYFGLKLFSWKIDYIEGVCLRVLELSNGVRMENFGHILGIVRIWRVPKVIFLLQRGTFNKIIDGWLPMASMNARFGLFGIVRGSAFRIYDWFFRIPIFNWTQHLRYYLGFGKIQKNVKFTTMAKTVFLHFKKREIHATGVCFRNESKIMGSSNFHFFLLSFSRFPRFLFMKKSIKYRWKYAYSYLKKREFLANKVSCSKNPKWQEFHNYCLTQFPFPIL